MAFLLVSWEADNSVSVIKRTAKALLSLEGDKVKFRWPRKGVYTGTVINSSSKEYRIALPLQLIPPLSGSKKKMEDMAKDMVATVEQERAEKSAKKRSKLSRTSSPLSQSPPLQKKTTSRGKSKQTVKQAAIVASNATAKSLFTETDKMRKLQEEIMTLRKQLECKSQVKTMLIFISVYHILYTGEYRYQ